MDIKQNNKGWDNEHMTTTKPRNYTPLIIGLSIAINVLVAILFFLPEAEGLDHIDFTVLPMMNAIFNSFTFVFLVAALFFIKQRNIRMHRNFIFAAFSSTTLFLLSYVTYHYATESTAYGGEGLIRYVYFFILITHIVLAIVIVPLALVTTARGLNQMTEKHRKIARWTMPLWLYVSLTGVIVYLMISPYYT
jgi:putative membrane protein